MPPLSGYIAGAGAPAPLLERMARPALVPPENFVGNIVFPDNKVDSFYNLAPIRGNEELEAFDDDTIGLKTDFPEVMISEGEYEFEIGFHGRKVIIGQLQQIKAKHAQAFASAAGNSGANAQFDLEARLTRVITAQTMRHAEFLKIQQLIDEDNYPAANVLDPIEIDTVTPAAFTEALSAAGAAVEAAGKGPANTIVFADDAWSGGLKNEGFKDFLPDDAYKILTPSAFTPILRLPEKSTTDSPAPRVLIASARYKRKKKDAPIPMMAGYIWIGRTNQAPDGSGEGFGYNHWHPSENGKQLFVYRIVVGSARNIHISVETFYRPLVNDGAQGALIPVTFSA